MLILPLVSEPINSKFVLIMEQIGSVLLIVYNWPLQWKWEFSINRTGGGRDSIFFARNIESSSTTVSPRYHCLRFQITHNLAA